MDGFDLNTIPVTNFVFDFKTPSGYMPFGYTKSTFGINILNKLKLKDSPFTSYYSSLDEPYNYKSVDSSLFSTYIVNHTPNTKFVLTNEIKNNIKKKELYIICIESLSFNNLFEYYSDININFDDFFSPELLKLFKLNFNFKLLFVDIREGAYPHTIKFLSKINDFLNKHEIYQRNKVLITTTNNFISNLESSEEFPKFKNRIKLYPHNFYISTAGKFISELRVKNNNIVENDYEYSIQQNINTNTKDKYFLMYNRNSERPHRSYFVNELYKLELLDKGFVSFFENQHLDGFLSLPNTQYQPLNLTNDDIADIRSNYKNYCPLFIDEPDADKVSNFHNFLSRKTEYEESYFTIVSETNAESEYCFITEKTLKPIMNLHPFVIVGNPKILHVLRLYGFKTFDKWWDESYDNDFDFKTRMNKVLKIVNYLCSKSKEEMNLLITEMTDVLLHNKNLLHKLYTSKTFEQEFYNNIIDNKDVI